MEVGINDDFDNGIDEDLSNEINDDLTSNEEINENISSEESLENPEDDSKEDVIDSYLKSKGIEDKSKIKFEDDEGQIEEKDWNSLSKEEKLNILTSSESAAEDGLDESEIQLINMVRSSGMSPSEYIDYIRQGVISEVSQPEPQYDIDQYTDDELFLMDLLSRTPDISQDEALEALEKAKSNEGLYTKRINAMRAEYQQIEQENLAQAQLEEEQEAEQQYNQFASQIVDEINGLTEFQGYDLNMDDDDKQEVYDFIVGKDAAGVNYMAKALADPQILVKTAWLALNGEQMINDITTYFQKEISNVRKESYKKGVDDTQKKMNGSNNVVFRSKNTKINNDYDDLDNF